MTIPLSSVLRELIAAIDRRRPSHAANEAEIVRDAAALRGAAEDQLMALRESGDAADADVV